MKLQDVYRDLLDNKVVSTDDITETVSELTDLSPRPQHVHNKYIRPLLRKGLMERIRKGLYYVNSVEEAKRLGKMDRFLLASKLRDDYYLSHHSALELHGCANSVFSTVYVSLSSESRFSSFQFRGIDFRPVSIKAVKLGTTTFRWRDRDIVTSDPHRTLVDCVDRPDLVGGWEECMKSLQDLPGIRIARVLNIIEGLEKRTLFNKVGYVLDILRGSSPYYEHISEADMEALRQNITRNPTRLQKGEDLVRSERWNLYVEDDFKEYLRGI